MRVQADLEQQRAVYQPVAVSAASLHLALAGLPALSPMYRFSQQLLLAVFQKALATAATSADVVMRIAAIQVVRSHRSLPTHAPSVAPACPGCIGCLWPAC